MFKRVLVFIIFIAFVDVLRAHATVWQPSPGHVQVPIWPGAAPDAEPFSRPETMEVGDALIGGKTATAVKNVSTPTMTVFSAKGRNTGVAVVVFPGGGYEMLAIDLEGTEVCDWLVPRGITCVLLKYRAPGGTNYPKSGPYPEAPQALEDAQRTVGLVRFHATEWHIDPHKIGVLGFSAGGHLAVAMSVYSGKRIYAPVDAADGVSCRPDFAVPIYPGHLNLQAAKWDANKGAKKRMVRAPPSADEELTLNPEIHVTHHVPPTFLLQNEDDHVDSVYDALSYFVALQRASVPAELHVYAQGGHAFGLRRTKLAATEWPQLVDRWLLSIGMVTQ